MRLIKKELFFEAIIKFIIGVILIGLLLFVSAGTIKYWNAWILMTLLFVPMFIVGIILMIKNPKLLEKRLRVEEKEKEQSLVIKLSGLMFLIGFMVAGLSYRFGWMQLPNWIIILGIVLFSLSYLMYGEVLRENTFLSRTIEVQENQKVIDTGLYGIIRHPMYTATIVLFLSMPLILGSLVSFIIFLVYPIIIIMRIKGEEELLEKELEGYKEYKQKIKFKLIPFLW